MPPNMSVSSTTPSPSSTVRDPVAGFPCGAAPCRRPGRCRPRATCCCWPDDMLQRGDELGGQPAMGHQNHADHRHSSVPFLRRARSNAAARAALEVAVDKRHALALARQPGGEPLGDIDRAVPPAGAADGDREIAFALALVARQQRRRSGPSSAVEERREGRIALDEAPTAGSRPVSGSQRRDVVRVGEEAHVEHQVGFARQAVPVGERDHGDRQARLARRARNAPAAAAAARPSSRSEVSITRSARSRSSHSSRRVRARCRRRPAGRRASGWRRRVSVKRRMQHVVVAVEEQQHQARCADRGAGGSMRSRNAPPAKSRVRLSMPMASGRRPRRWRAADQRAAATAAGCRPPRSRDPRAPAAPWCGRRRTCR